ncbi:MAG: CidA/LrgA family protein, partial [Lysinibacillus sp.]
MQIIRIIAQIAILWLFYFIGELIVTWTGIIIPASIIGLVLLWICLMTGLINPKLIKDGASFLIAFLTLFFIPSTVGVIEYPELLSKAGILLVIAVTISSAVAFIVTGKVSQYIEKKE